MTLKAPWSGESPFFSINNSMSSDFPSRFQQAKNLAQTAGRAAWTAAQGNGVFVPDEIKKSRMNICISCPHFSRVDVRCIQCGCYLETKTALRASKCPVDKWSFHLTDN